MFLGDPLLHAWRTVISSKKILVLVSFADLVVCAPAGIYVLRQVNGLAAHRADALELARRYDQDFMADLRSGASGFDANVTALVIASFVLFALLRPLVLGGYVGLAATNHKLRLGAFLREGGAVYWKFLRLAVLGGIAAWLLSLAAKPLITQVNSWAEARPEPTSNRYLLVTNVVLFAGFCLVSMVFEYARVGVRVERRPGIFAGIGRAAVFVLLKHPARTVTLFLVSFALECGAILGFARLVQVADGGYFATSAIVLVLVQILVLLREAARLFHVAGAWQLVATEAGEELEEPAVTAVALAESDVLRAPLPWHVR
jgi:hypothetical protein